jgi:O-antigen/teichoic acid export membrane protein
MGATRMEMKRRQIFLNAASASGQILASAAVMFFLYRFLIRAVGVERLGIWSLVLATTSVVTLANQGISASIVKFVAKYAAREKTEEVSLLVQTAVISTGLALALVSAGLYPAARYILEIVLPRASLAETWKILPIALVSLWITILVGVLQAGLVGHEMIALCNYLELSGAVAYLLLALLLVPSRGLLGLAYAQTIAAAALMVATWVMLRRRIPSLPLVPRRWNRALFREMAGYGFQFQLITASQAMREPVTKALLAKFGGLAVTGLYELAARSVVTLREIIVQANQVLVPTVSGLQERDPDSVPAVYRESYRLIFFLAIPAFAFLVVASPFISQVWIGRYEPLFVRFVALLAAGWLVNVLTNPAYVVRLGTGALRWVLAGCVSMTILNATLGFVAGSHWGGTAVVAASAASLAGGYLIVLVSYHLANRAPFAQLLPEESREILFASLLAAAMCLPYFCSWPPHSIISLRVTAGMAVALAAIMAIPMWIHPMRKRLLHWVLSSVQP